jgi:hypothetical protein
VWRPALFFGALILLFSPAQLSGNEYSKTEHYSVRMFSYGTLTVNARIGDVTIHGWDNPRLTVRARKVVHARSRKEAAKLYHLIKIRFQGRDHNIRLYTLYPPRRLWRPFRDESKLSVNLHIRMPYDANLRLKCVDGDVTVSGLTQSVKLDDSYGDVEVDVPSAYKVRLLDAHSWLGYVQSDLQGMPQDGAGFSKRISFSNIYGSQVIIVRVRMGGVFVYGERDWDW